MFICFLLCGLHMFFIFSGFLILISSYLFPLRKVSKEVENIKYDLSPISSPKTASLNKTNIGKYNRVQYTNSEQKVLMIKR